MIQVLLMIFNGFYFSSQRLLLCILLTGDELVSTLHCDVLYDVNGCLVWINAVFNVIQGFISATLTNPQ